MALARPVSVDTVWVGKVPGSFLSYSETFLLPSSRSLTFPFVARNLALIPKPTL